MQLKELRVSELEDYSRELEEALDFREDIVSPFTVVFTIATNNLPNLLNVQKRTLDKHLLKLTPSKALKSIEKYFTGNDYYLNKVKRVVDRYLFSAIDEHFGEYADHVNYKVIDIDLAPNTTYNEVIIDTINKELTFELQFDVIYEVYHR